MLIVQHAQHEHPAVVRRALQTQGIETIWLHSYRGEPYPKVSEISGMISLGGPMSANDEEEHPWITREIQLLGDCVEKGLPVVGICLGGQMMARALGARVEKNREVELGWFPIEITSDGQADPILGAAGDSPMVYHWHFDTFHLPGGSTLLAYSRACPRQAYRVGAKAYGFQFHPEADHQLVVEWLSYEGIDEEILGVQKAFGTRTVQNAKTQIDRALKGEKASLKITAGIGALFRREETEPADDGIRELIEVCAFGRYSLMVEFCGPEKRIMHLRGRIATILTIPAGEFVLFLEGNGLLWPIRIEDILAIHPLS